MLKYALKIKFKINTYKKITIKCINKKLLFYYFYVYLFKAIVLVAIYY